MFREGELDEKTTRANFAQVQKEGKREVNRNIEHYNLDVIISVGYRIKSKRCTEFRQWAIQVLHGHLTQGGTLNHLAALTLLVAESIPKQKEYYH